MKEIPVAVLYVILAIGGGIARYLSGYISGSGFTWRLFFASALVSAFSGYMFSLLGTSLSLPLPFISMMAGTGGFMGDQAMKFIIEYLTRKVT